jgi:hypothetical protein
MSVAAESDSSELFESFHGHPPTTVQNVGVAGPNPNLAAPVFLDLCVAGDADRMTEFGLCRQHVASIAGDDFEFEQSLRQRMFGDSFAEDGLPPPLSAAARDLISIAGVRPLPYVQTVLRSGHFLTVCPISGRPVKSEGSFVVDNHHIAYRFCGDVVFYLFVGRFHARRAALYLPSQSLLVTLDVPERGIAISKWIAHSMKKLIESSLADPSGFRARLEANPGQLTLVVGGMGNLGHHIWQELSGIAELVGTTNLNKVRCLLAGPHTWFRLDKVFPELAQVPVVNCAREEDMALLGANVPGTLVRPIGTHITSDLRQRLRSAAAAAVGPEQEATIAAAAARARLIWINLRAHNKMWQTQVEGYSNLLNTLNQEFGNIGVIYDGWMDTTKIRDEIDGRLDPRIPRHDTIGVPIHSSLIWAGAVTAYVSVVGSGLVLNSWLVQKPGIAHANRAHLHQQTFWNSVSIGMIPTNFIDRSLVSDNGSLYGNYDFDWRLLLPYLRDVLTNAPAPLI